MADRVSRRLLFACVTIATAALPACNGGDSAPPPTAPPPPAPPPPPAFAVSFADGELEINEGETLMFTVRYEVPGTRRSAGGPPRQLAGQRLRRRLRTIR